MVIILLVNFIVLAWIILRLEATMADFTRLTTAVEELAVEVEAAVAVIAAGHGGDAAVQAAIDAATTAVKVQSDKLLAAIPPPAST